MTEPPAKYDGKEIPSEPPLSTGPIDAPYDVRRSGTVGDEPDKLAKLMEIHARPSTVACPYCRSEVRAGSESCPACGTSFPWATEAAALRDELKARETNRFRATYALVEEVLQATRGGAPVSLAAVKGFVTAMLFPRVVIILGSLIGATVLCFQTYILWGQTKLLAQQAEAAQVDRADKLRIRIANTQQLESDMRELLFFLKDTRAIVTAAPEKRACRGECRNKRYYEVLDETMALRAWEQLPDTDRRKQHKVYGSHAANELQEIQRQLDRIAEWPSNSVRQQGATSYRDDIGIQSKRATQALNSVKLSCLQPDIAYIEWALMVARNLLEPDRITRSPGLMPIYASNGLPDLRSYVKAKDDGRRDYTTYTLGEFTDDVAEYTDIAMSQITHIRLVCSSAIQRDTEAMREITR